MTRRQGRFQKSRVFPKISQILQQHPVRIAGSKIMYSDRIAASGNQRTSVKERLGGKGAPALGVARKIVKRPRANDDKWQHDLFDKEGGIKVGGRKGRLPTGDLRHKLTTAGGVVRQAEKPAGGLRVVVRNTGAKVPDLRQKLSGVVAPVPVRPVTTTDRPVTHAKPAGQRKLASVVSKQAGSSQPVIDPAAQQGNGAVSLSAFLKRLGLEKYLPILQAEEVDVAALRQISDEDLKELGIPMGPRKKLLQAAKVH